MNLMPLPTLNEKQMKEELWKHNAIIINQETYPFSFQEINIDSNGLKPTWYYQQLLKLYSHEVIKGLGYDITEDFLVIDSDTAIVRPVNFFLSNQLISQSLKGGYEKEGAGRYIPLHSVASSKAGSFSNVDNVGSQLANEVFNRKDEKIGRFKKAFPDHDGTTFTAITHHMIFNSEILREMLDFISGKAGGVKAWRVLSSLKRSVLSEWELYAAYVMHFHRSSIGVRQLP